MKNSTILNPLIVGGILLLMAVNLSGCNAGKAALAGAASAAAISAVSGRSGDDIMRDAGVGAVGGAAAGFVYDMF